MMMRPAVSSSSPATARNSVDLPHPDGPTITVNSPSATSIDTPFRTSVAPKLLSAPSTDNPDMIPRVPGPQWTAAPALHFRAGARPSENAKRHSAHDHEAGTATAR